MSEARDKALLAKRASVTLGQAAARLRSSAIDAAADLLQERSAEVIEANRRDLQRARQSGMPEPLQTA